MRTPIRKVLGFFLVWAAMAVLAPHSLRAQGAASGSFVGLVQDSSGAVVPGAVVAARNLGTNINRSEVTAASGVFTIPNLPPGSYEIRVSKPGFRNAVVADAKLDVDATFRVNITLEIGEVSETVHVNAAPPPLQTDEASVGHVIEQERIVDLPLNGRSFQQLQLLSPGAVNTYNFQTSSGLAGGASSLQNVRDPVVVSSNGSRPTQMLVLIDGVNVMHQTGRSMIISPNPDEIGEVKIQGSNFSAEYGYGSNIINVSTKSGTNKLRGTVWEFLRNDKLDSRSFFSQQVDPLKRNQFGVTLGGPVVIPKLYNGRNRTFWSFDYEGQRERDGKPAISSVPTARMRGGDLSELPVRIYDPASSRSAPGGSVTRDVFPGNVIPQNRLDPVGQLFLQWIPLPNRSGVANNFLNEVVNYNDFNHYSTRIDQKVSDRDSLFFRHSYHLGQFPNALGPYVGYSKDPYNPGQMPKRANGTSVVLDWVHTFNPTTLVDSRVGYVRSYQIINNLGVIPGGTDWTAAAGIQGFGKGISDVFPSFPEMDISGFTGLPGAGGNGLENASNDWEYTTNFTLVRGKHTLKTGFSHRRWATNNTNYGNGSGIFAYTGVYSNNPAAPTGTGSGLADYLVQNPFQGQRYAPPGWFYRRLRNVFTYFQDDWKVTSKLTVNLGLRYEINFPLTMKNNAISTFLPSGRNGRGAIVVPNEESIDVAKNPSGEPAIPLSIPVYRPLIITAAQAGIPERSLRNTSYRQFAPRVGLAYRLDSATVLRAGYGIFYLQPDGNREGEYNTAPFIVREPALLNTTDSNGAPAHTTQTLLPANSQFAPQPSMTAHDPNISGFGYVQQWNLFVQRSLPASFVLDIGYVGNRGDHLQQGREINSPPPGPGAVQARRPFPDFLTLSWNEMTGISSYHALQTKMERRFQKGLTATASFTWSKSIDLNTASDNTVGFDPYNLRSDRGPSDFDSPRIFSASVVYELPFLRSRHDIPSRILGGWTVTSIFAAQDGYPFTPNWSGDVANTGRGERPNRTCNGSLADPSIRRWFDTSCFVAPAIYTYGNSGRNILRGPGFLNWDAGVYKSFRISEQTRLQVRSEFFNALNHANFAPPALTINAGTPGVITASGPGRQIQLAMKLNF